MCVGEIRYCLNIYKMRRKYQIVWPTAWKDYVRCSLPEFHQILHVIENCGAFHVRCFWTRMPSGIWSRLYGSFLLALNTWSKVWPCNLKLCTDIWSTNINFRPPLHGIFVRLGLNFHPMGEFGEGWEGGSIGPPTFFVTDGQKRDYLSRASRALLRGGATKNQNLVRK